MTLLDSLYSLAPWHLLTRLGEAQILLPAAALTMLALLARASTRKLALIWMTLIILATVITTASKVAFIGWGIGWADIDFTGISGHAMFASAIYPVLMVTFFSGRWRGAHRLSLALGCALALVVGLSRIEVGAHSWSEVLAGWAVGGAVSAVALALSETSAIVIRPIVPVLLLAWVAVMPFKLHASPTHSFVIRLAVAMSGNETPFQRSDLLHPARRQNALAC
ncbi:phosphatase PAP2 family protein [Polaromonas sp. DSR2-3-2]|uniref:phosphatase PAP2 family protein n=1 Tax=unclassified Polaromonas TaxID=2638319 RepID=UPI003CEE9CA6